MQQQPPSTITQAANLLRTAGLAPKGATAEAARLRRLQATQLIESVLCRFALRLNTPETPRNEHRS
jgi:hypothetical protein